jgi:protein-S-isoprenylcysteine O-methyltransferase Ste14
MNAKRALPRLMPPFYVLIACLAMVGLHFGLPIVHLPLAWWNLVGLLPLALGVALNLRADDLFRRARTTVRPFAESSTLVTDGPFRLSRNPMYLGFALVLTGVAILLGSVTPFLVIPAFVILIDRRFIRVEEGMLASKFGAAWQAYCARTRRWI